MYQNAARKVFVAGHRGMVGSAISRQLRAAGWEVIERARDELDLTNQSAVRDFFRKHQIDQVYLAAAKVGGIHANNTYPAEFIYQNLMLQSNVIHSAFECGVKKLLFLGSSCIYPRLAPQPMNEEDLLTGKLEPTNEPYAIAKISGIKMVESYNRQYGQSSGIDYRSVMPTNLYGPGDNYHETNSHVLPALIRRLHEAKERALPTVSIWGTGTPKREFLYVEDMAAASIFVMNISRLSYESSTGPNASYLNIGSGDEVSIGDLARMVADVIGYSGTLLFDSTKPDGAPRKLLDSGRISALGWSPVISLKAGIELAYKGYLSGH